MNSSRNPIYVIGGMALLLLTACVTTTPETPSVVVESAAVEGETLVLGDISDDPIEVIEEAQPLVDYLAANLGDFGITEGQVKIASSIEEMSELLANGEVDLYFDSVYPVTVAGDLSGAQPFIRRWKGGVSEYHTVIFASAESGITSIDDLLGHTIAFEEDFSTSGYVLPLAYLVEQGFTPVEKDSPDDSIADGEVGYVFSGAHENSLQWVVSGRLDAAATENGDFEEVDPELQNDLVVLAETESLPRHVGVVRPDMDVDLLAAITALLLEADSTSEGRDALEAFAGTVKFDEFPEGIDRATVRMRELFDIVQDAQ